MRRARRLLGGHDPFFKGHGEVGVLVPKIHGFCRKIGRKKGVKSGRFVAQNIGVFSNIARNTG